MCLAGAGKKNLISLAFLIKVTSFRYEIFVYLKYLSGGNRECGPRVITNLSIVQESRITFRGQKIYSHSALSLVKIRAQIVRSISK